MEVCLWQQRLDLPPTVNKTTSRKKTRTLTRKDTRTPVLRIAALSATA